MKLKWPLLFLFLFCVTSVQAQMYRWVDADGKVTYSDKAPPPSAVKQKKQTQASDSEAPDGLNYALSEAVRNFPVTLYTSADCGPCDEGRSLLKTRGIPFSEKSIVSDNDLKALKQVGGTTQLPYLTIGRNTSQTGFEASLWHAALTVAGYPQTNQLPPGYQSPPPASAAPPAPPVVKPEAPEAPATPPPPAQGGIPGFRF